MRLRSNLRLAIAIGVLAVVGVIGGVGCRYDIHAEYNGKLENGLCVPTGNECRLDVTVTGGQSDNPHY